MPKYAKVENLVVQLVRDYESAPDETWREITTDDGYGLYPEPGWGYSPEHNAFVTPKPFPSWTFNPSTLNWDAPITRPNVEYPLVPRWDETTQKWEIFNLEQ